MLRSVRKPSTAAFATASGPVGDHQMVEIAKTLLNDPRILIFDEPTACSPARRSYACLPCYGASAKRESGSSDHLHEVMEIRDRVSRDDACMT